jgi:hypothetical protein
MKYFVRKSHLDKLMMLSALDNHSAGSVGTGNEFLAFLKILRFIDSLRIASQSSYLGLFDFLFVIILYAEQKLKNSQWLEKKCNLESSICFQVFHKYGIIKLICPLARKA